MSVPESLIFDTDLITRYDRPGPRYTSYPTAPHFQREFSAADYAAQLERSNDQSRPLSLYVHIPFCEHLCFYCACTKVVTRHREWGEPYVQRLEQEMRLLRRHVDGERPVVQLHFGGGTPTFLRAADMDRLLDAIHRHFRLLPEDRGEYGVEVDPRALEPGMLARLREFGCNRLSMGVQDLDPSVQKAVHREQSLELVTAVLAEARALGYRSISLDLIYGLPRQNRASFADTLEAIIALRPDRLSLFNYAHLPERFAPQRRIVEAELPSPALKLDILRDSIARLQAAGYVYIGMDHFALPEDELTLAQQAGTLHRNFQGYSTHAEADLLALGMSAISATAKAYSQNHKDLETWNAAIDAQRLPVERGWVLSDEDRLRRHVITRLICDFRLSRDELEERFAIDFPRHFAAEWPQLLELEEDGLVTWDGSNLIVTARGRLLVRHVCMVFDAYLGQKSVRYSRVI
ncbi:MAG: oxygen-independent coproporphyrinogen III oxidase [Acidithiobacillus sp.]|uniref:oxygen-independent coproporphyrinogen III oxidase n=1 Tax=Acidithiobacillus sp. TaxID=1872118 RepID=UPI003D06646F